MVEGGQAEAGENVGCWSFTGHSETSHGGLAPCEVPSPCPPQPSVAGSGSVLVGVSGSPHTRCTSCFNRGSSLHFAPVQVVPPPLPF